MDPFSEHWRKIDNEPVSQESINYHKRIIRNAKARVRYYMKHYDMTKEEAEYHDINKYENDQGNNEWDDLFD